LQRVGGSQPFNYFMIMKYEPFYVKVLIDDSVYGDFGHDDERPQECAKRIIFEHTGKRPEFVQALSGQERIEVSSVSENIRSKWPCGAKTIPVYNFTSLK